MQIKYGTRSEEELKRASMRSRTMGLKSVVIGVLIFALMAFAASIWRFASMEGSLRRLKEFEFAPEPPDTEKFELEEPLRELMQQKFEDTPEMRELEQMPDIQVTTDPTESEMEDEVIQTENIEMVADIDVDFAEMDIIEAPEDLDELANETEFAATPIAAVVSRPADLYKYKEPAPRRRSKVTLLNRATQESRGLKVTPSQFGDLDAPTVGELGRVNINLLGSGEYMSAMGRSGGMETRTAVDAALRWLVLHQEADGHWESSKWNDEAVRYDGTGGSTDTTTTQYPVALGGFASLALMGGGHTIRKGEYRTQLIRAMEWLMKRQEASGDGRLSDNMYEHAIGTIALCEAFGRAPDERIGLAARKAVNFCTMAVGTDSGWRYSPNPQQSDVSVTSWFLQALKTAKLADIKFDHRVFSRGLAYIDQLTDKGGGPDSAGGVGYTYVPTLAYGAGSRPLTCAAMVIRQFSGMGVRSPILVKAARLTQKNPPSWESKDFYYWYYATYAMHNMGGEYRIWWNRRIRDVLLDNQSKRGHQAGSWNPKGLSFFPDRTYATALGALCLEVYYRYGEALQSFGIAPDLEDLFFQ